MSPFANRGLLGDEHRPKGPPRPLHRRGDRAAQIPARTQHPSGRDEENAPDPEAKPSVSATSTAPIASSSSVVTRARPQSRIPAKESTVNAAAHDGPQALNYHKADAVMSEEQARAHTSTPLESRGVRRTWTEAASGWTDADINEEIDAAAKAFPALAHCVAQLSQVCLVTKCTSNTVLGEWARGLRIPLRDVEEWLQWRERRRETRRAPSPSLSKRIKLSPTRTDVSSMPAENSVTEASADSSACRVSNPAPILSPSVRSSDRVSTPPPPSPALRGRSSRGFSDANCGSGSESAATRSVPPAAQSATRTTTTTTTTAESFVVPPVPRKDSLSSTSTLSSPTTPFTPQRPLFPSQSHHGLSTQPTQSHPASPQPPQPPQQVQLSRPLAASQPVVPRPRPSATDVAPQSQPSNAAVLPRPLSQSHPLGAPFSQPVAGPSHQEQRASRPVHIQLPQIYRTPSTAELQQQAFQSARTTIQQSGGQPQHVQSTSPRSTGTQGLRQHVGQGRPPHGVLASQPQSQQFVQTAPHPPLPPSLSPSRPPSLSTSPRQPLPAGYLPAAPQPQLQQVPQSRYPVPPESFQQRVQTSVVHLPQQQQSLPSATYQQTRAPHVVQASASYHPFALAPQHQTQSIPSTSFNPGALSGNSGQTGQQYSSLPSNQYSSGGAAPLVPVHPANQHPPQTTNAQSCVQGYNPQAASSQSRPVAPQAPVFVPMPSAPVQPQAQIFAQRPPPPLSQQHIPQAPSAPQQFAMVPQQSATRQWVPAPQSSHIPTAQPAQQQYQQGLHWQQQQVLGQQRQAVAQPQFVPQQPRQVGPTYHSQQLVGQHPQQHLAGQQQRQQQFVGQYGQQQGGQYQQPQLQLAAQQQQQPQAGQYPHPQQHQVARQQQQVIGQHPQQQVVGQYQQQQVGPYQHQQQRLAAQQQQRAVVVQQQQPHVGQYQQQAVARPPQPQFVTQVHQQRQVVVPQPTIAQHQQQIQRHPQVAGQHSPPVPGQQHPQVIPQHHQQQVLPQQQQPVVAQQQPQVVAPQQQQVVLRPQQPLVAQLRIVGDIQHGPQCWKTHMYQTGCSAVSMRVMTQDEYAMFAPGMQALYDLFLWSYSHDKQDQATQRGDIDGANTAMRIKQSAEVRVRAFQQRRDPVSVNPAAGSQVERPTLPPAPDAPRAAQAPQAGGHALGEAVRRFEEVPPPSESRPTTAVSQPPAPSSRPTPAVPPISLPPHPCGATADEIFAFLDQCASGSIAQPPPWLVALKAPETMAAARNASAAYVREWVRRNPSSQQTIMQTLGALLNGMSAGAGRGGAGEGAARASVLSRQAKVEGADEGCGLSGRSPQGIATPNPTPEREVAQAHGVSTFDRATVSHQESASVSSI